MTNEQSVLELIAMDRIEIPLSSLYQKIKRDKKGQANQVVAQLGDKTKYNGERSNAYLVDEDKEKARGMKEAVVEFADEFPKYGKILAGKIAEKRVKTEKHLYFGINEGCKLTGDDYIAVMTSLGLSESTARSLYPDLMELSRKLAKRQGEKRRIIVGKYDSESDD